MQIKKEIEELDQFIPGSCCATIHQKQLRRFQKGLDELKKVFLKAITEEKEVSPLEEIDKIFNSEAKNGKEC